MGLLRRAISAIRRNPQPEDPPIVWVEHARENDGGVEPRDPALGIHEPPRRLSFLLSLPFDVPVPQNTTATVFEAGFFVGWEEVRISPFPSLPPWPEPGLSPGTSFWLRRTEVSVEDSIGAISDAFADQFPTTMRPRRRRKVTPITATRAVVQITRIAPAPSDASEEAGEAWLSGQFDRALEDLNEFLVILASVTGEASIGPVAKQELPPAFPFFLTSLEESASGAPQDEPSLFLLHVGTEGEIDLIPPGRFEHVGAVQAKHRGEGHPFFPYAEAMVSARRSLLFGRAGQAALEAGTAAELLITTVIREVGPLRGVDPRKLQNVIDGPFRSRFEHHLGPMTGLGGELTDSASPAGAWYSDAYELRNRIVHRGYRPSLDEAGRALRATTDLMKAIGRSLQADSLTRELGEMLVSFEEVRPED